MRFNRLAMLGLIASLHFGAGSVARAQGIDSATRDMLIQKLTQVYLNLAPADASKVALTLRLADLHAERARVASMKELGEGCTVCNAGKEDRTKALAYYQEILPKVSESSMGKVLTQVGHLYEMTGNQTDAIATYNKILKDQKSPEAAAQAHLSLAELYFKRREFVSARENYSKVLAIPQAGSRGLASYRLAWCEFNEGNLEPAISGLEKILKSSELLSRSAASGIIQVDKQFQEEVSRDLATFLARRNVTVKDAQLVYDLSPEQAKMANVTYLASEVERLGQIASAIDLWRFVQEKQAKPQARLEGHIRLAQLQMEQKQFPGASRDFESSLALWSSLGTCNDNDCRELKVRMRKFVLDWNRVEKKTPSEQLLAAYQSYLKTFSNEADMALWAAKVAADLKQYSVSVELYQRGARLSSELAANPGADKDAAKDAKSGIEAGLLGAIEAAELSKEPKLLDTAYDTYLSMSTDRKRAVEVQYQKARLIYDRAEYGPAAVALREVALSKDVGAKEIKKQAADLSLDSLVLLKDDVRLENWSAEYAKAFPESSKEFAGIVRKSVLTQSAATASKGSQADLEEAWKTLARFDLATASAEDKASYYKNKLILAEKLGKFGEARDAVENMLRSPNLSSADQQFALSRKAWLAEMVLDFETALSATEKIAGGELAGGQKWLKLAMYADLASKDAKPFYTQFLKESKDDDKNVAIAAQLVRESKDPLKEIEKSRAVLAKRPEALGNLYLEIYAKTGSSEIARKGLATAGVAATPSGKILTRVLLLEEYSKMKTKIVSHQLDASNQKKMAQSLKARVAMLDEVEKLASRAIESGDWTSQLVVLDLLGKQNDRFYQEVLGLPVPAGLSGEEEQQYLMLLSQQAAPHQLRAADVAKKVDEFWQNEAALTQLDQAMTTQTGALRAILVREATVLAEVAPETKKTRVVEIAGRKELARETPTLAVLEGARQAVREAPLNRTHLESLLTLEKKMGRQSMVAYLEGRLQTLESPESKSETKLDTKSTTNQAPVETAN